jgi:hypothetical protein
MSGPSNGHPRDLLSEYLDDELGLEERATVDRHLAVCEDCRTELETLRRLARALAEEKVPSVPVDLEARIGRRLDEATLVRPTRWRFAVPATIAATLAAVGLLVAVLWREGRIGVPPAPAPAPASAPADESKQRALDKVQPSFAPAPSLEEQAPRPPREKAAARPDAFEKDLPVTPEQHPERDAENAPAGAPAGVAGGVIGGVEGGVADDVEGGVATGAKEKVAAQVAAADERQERAAAKVASQVPTLMKPAPPPAAKVEIPSVCSERWIDSGLRARWNVQDVTAAVWDLGRMARDVGGIGVWHGVADGGPYVLVVPRLRFEEVFFALRARGMEGLAEPPALAAGSECAGISIDLVAPR